MTVYVVLEGGDGCGKSTQARLLVERLRRSGRAVAHLREPGSTAVGERLRELLLDPRTGELSATAEALLFFAARDEMVRREVAPALGAGAVVVAERCYLSTWVYQGAAAEDGLPEPLLDALTRQVHGRCLPHRVFVLDVSYEVALRRRGGQVEDRIEARGREYHERVRASYLAIAGRRDEMMVMDAGQAPDTLHEQLAVEVERLLEVRA